MFVDFVYSCQWCRGVNRPDHPCRVQRPWGKVILKLQNCGIESKRPSFSDLPSSFIIFISAKVYHTRSLNPIEYFFPIFPRTKEKSTVTFSMRFHWLRNFHFRPGPHNCVKQKYEYECWSKNTISEPGAGMNGQWRQRRRVSALHACLFQPNSYLHIFLARCKFHTECSRAITFRSSAWFLGLNPARWAWSINRK